MIRTTVSFMCLQKAKWVGKRKRIRHFKFKTILSNGVSIIVDKEWKKIVVNVKRMRDMIIVQKLVTKEDTFDVTNEHAREDRVRNEHIGEKVGGTLIIEKMTESCLILFGYVWSRPVNSPKTRIDQMEVNPILK
ncbi:hypothetical protein Lal_00021418 [Lupinus albus]|nr:hypothetical protein Lal_00021418 [Lupinus albus]